MPVIKSSVKKTFVHYLITYLCISMIIVLLLLPIYYTAYKNAQRIIAQEQSQQIIKGFWMLQSALEDCRTYAYNMASNISVNRIRFCKEDDPDLPKYLYNMVLYQQNNYWENSLVDEVVIQFRNNDALITRYSIYQDKHFFYEEFFNYSNVSYSGWQQSLFTEQKSIMDITDVRYKGNTTRSFTANYYYPSMFTPSMVISFIIPYEKVMSMLMTEEVKNHGSIDIIYGANKETAHLMYHTDYDAYTDLISISSLQPPLSLKAGLSPAAYAEAVLPIRTTLLVYIFVAISAAILMSVLFTVWNMRPVRAVINKISQLEIHTGNFEGDAYSFILQTITGMTELDQQHKKAYALAQNSLEFTLFSMAMKGLPIDPYQMELALGNIPALKGTYILAGISGEPHLNDWPSEYDPEIMMVVAQRLFTEKVRDPYFCRLDNLYVVLSAQSEEGVSQVFGTLVQLTEATDQVAYCLISSQYGIYPSIVWYDQISKIIPEKIPVNEELLYTSLLQDETESDKSYYNILLHNVCSEYHSALYAKTVYYNVIAICQRALSVLPDNHKVILREYDSQASIRSNMTCLKDICDKLHEMACLSRKNQKLELAKKIMEYIRLHYASSSLSLTMVADYFSLSERYLSSIIRELTGKSYADYLIDLRMAEARRLLIETDTPVNDIAGKVGYDLTNSFYKTFKNYTGLSPKQYRMTNGYQ